MIPENIRAIAWVASWNSEGGGGGGGGWWSLDWNSNGFGGGGILARNSTGMGVGSFSSEFPDGEEFVIKITTTKQIFICEIQIWQSGQ